MMDTQTSFIYLVSNGFNQLHLKLGSRNTDRSDLRFVWDPFGESDHVTGDLLKQRPFAPSYDEAMGHLGHRDFRFGPSRERFLRRMFPTMKIVWHGAKHRLRTVFKVAFMALQLQKIASERAYAPDGIGALAAAEEFYQLA